MELIQLQWLRVQNKALQVLMLIPHSFGKSTLLTIEGIKSLVLHSPISCLQIGVIPFELKVVLVRDSEHDLQNVHDSPKIEHWPFSNKSNQTQPINRKWKSVPETPEEKEKWLIARCEYEKIRKVNESEESNEKRLAQQHLKRKKKCANKSSESRKKRLSTQKNKKKQNKNKKNCKRISRV